MSINRRSLAAFVVAGAAALAGCQTTTVTGPSPAHPSAAASTPSAAAPASGTVPSRTSGSESAPAERCSLDQLTASLGRTTGEAGQRHTAVVWTNTSRAACVMDGFGGVDLQGPDDPMGPTYSLPRTSETPQSFSLAPGQAAHTTITWLPPQDGPGWTPSGMLVTPPNETRSARIDWPGGAVLRQDGATHPGTYIGPVSPGAEG
ncbi:DUF4232 domain-containing protein [Pseudonocardia adelaidensis]|uniref:DUF4232 domain-containing protein n=1 Tax=Pseudonocardia adelaidensis TaxID=648754 RepID=A0ABP9PEU3_9PSEU